MQDGLDALHKTGTWDIEMYKIGIWDIVPLPSDKHAICCK